MAEPVISVHDLKMRYGERDVLRGVSFDIARGELVTLLGPNGAGKTTTLEILEGFRRRSGGEVAVLGRDPQAGDDAWRSRIGIVLQSWSDHKMWRLGELIAQVRAHYLPYRDPYGVDELLSLVRLESMQNERVLALSGGQRRRLDVALGLVGRPDVLFLDEPTVGFDPEARQEFHDLIHRLTDLERTTILLTTHDLAETEKLSDRIMILSGGTIIENDTPANLARRYSRSSQVSYRVHDQSFVHPTQDATAYLMSLFAEHGAAVTNLEVRQSSLESVYLQLIRAQEDAA